MSQIVFPNEGEAQAARSRIASGTSFDDLAKERNLNLSDVDLGLIAKSAIIDPAIADAAFSLPSGEVSQPVQGRFGVALVKIGKIEPGVMPTFESVAAQVKKEIATERARAKVNEIQNKMEDERSGGANVVEASQKLGLTPVTIDAVDRSGRLPNGQPVTNIPRGLDVVSQAFNSDVGVDNEPIRLPAAMSGTTCSALRPRASARSMRFAARSRRNGAKTRSRASCGRKRPRWCKSSSTAARLPRSPLRPDRRSRPRPVSAATPRRPACLPPPSRRPSGLPKDGVGQTPGSGGSEWIVFRVTDVIVPPVETASEELKKLKDTLQRGLTDEQVAQYVNKIESEIGTTINQAAFAQVTGANN